MENNDRLIRLEASHASIADSLQALTKRLNQIDEHTNKSITELRSVITESKRPQWNLWVSAISMLFIIIASLGAMSLSPLTISTANQQKEIDALKTIAEGSTIRNAIQETHILNILEEQKLYRNQLKELIHELHSKSTKSEQQH
jgi:hypothetical protein